MLFSSGLMIKSVVFFTLNNIGLLLNIFFTLNDRVYIGFFTLNDRVYIVVFALNDTLRVVFFVLNDRDPSLLSSR